MIPIIQFSIDKDKLKKTSIGTESATLNWEVSNAVSVELKCGNTIISTDLSNNHYIIKPQTDSKYELIVTGLDNHTKFRSELNVMVREPANVSFDSDKLFTLPGIPITISWDVKRAKSVRLNNNSVGLKGQQIFTPNRDEHYILTYEDDFGNSFAELYIKMLPLPVVKSILIDTPCINEVAGIQYSTPQFHTIPNLPSIESTFASLNIPEVSDINYTKLTSKLPESPNPKFSEKVSHFLKTIFS